jgi:GntR family transcriptional regulator
MRGKIGPVWRCSSLPTAANARLMYAPELAGRLKVGAGAPAVEVHRTYKTSDGEVAQVTINTHPASRFRHSMTLRRVKG